ncbi:MULTISPECIES: DoxX family protein [unclassified Arthrobacter]|uniref:DoxX family protein n=1 Tax=unclassified Arthrobacter TaxID=235627 RepID=UPI0014917897|nr:MULTISPECIES: DoxX family protein [unclassified Arthrobacter]MBE0009239.1 hypothetical protein [Arthrobacter sp. AET 35A]NOJ62951.1 DoxX family protein [Arthrobacter sp. 147(2020)]
MSTLPEPVWPVIALALIQVMDGVLCLKPVGFVARCFEDVNWPRRYWWVMSPIKFAAATGLLLGLWVPYLGAITTGALVLYFVGAVIMHVRARDFGRNLFVNATAMLAICVGTLVACFLL